MKYNLKGKLVSNGNSEKRLNCKTSVVDITTPIKVPTTILDKISTAASYIYILVDCLSLIPMAL
jgi:hypothetical protein